MRPTVFYFQPGGHGKRAFALHDFALVHIWHRGGRASRTLSTLAFASRVAMRWFLLRMPTAGNSGPVCGACHGSRGRCSLYRCFLGRSRAGARQRWYWFSLQVQICKIKHLTWRATALPSVAGAAGEPVTPYFNVSLPCPRHHLFETSAFAFAGPFGLQRFGLP